MPTKPLPYPMDASMVTEEDLAYRIFDITSESQASISSPDLATDTYRTESS